MTSFLSPVFSKINQFVRCNPSRLLNNVKVILPAFANTNYSSQLAKPVEFNLIDKNTEKQITETVIKNVNKDLDTSPRTFAVVHICGKQFKVTTDDVIIVEGYWPPDVGDTLRLDKVLCAGGENFSLIGRPLIEPGLVNVYATVIEKNLSHTKTHFRKKRRKQYMRINFYRIERTMLRINEIGIGKLKESVD